MITLYNHDTEKHVIGGLLWGADEQKLLPALVEDMMHDPPHRQILSAMKEMRQKKTPIDIQTLASHLTDAGEIDQVGGAPYLLQCFRFCSTTANLRHHIGELRRLMESRNAYRMANQFCHQLLEGEDLASSVDDLRTQLRNLVTPKDRLVRMSELAPIVYDDVEKRSRGEHVTLASRIPDLDNFTGGFEQTDFVVIGARPAVGKSAFGMQIALNVAQAGKRVMVCSREMSDLQYGHRIASNLGEINGQRLRRGQLDADEWAALTQVCNDMGGYAISFAFENSTVEELRIMAQHEMDTRGLDLILVDYLQILETSSRKAKRYEEVGAISRALKMLALDLKVPVIAMAQVGRQAEKRTLVMPTLSELRESGNIEQDADTVIFLHHPEGESDKSIPALDLPSWKGIENLPGHQYIVVSIAKQRQGVCRNFGIDFDAAHMKYTCIHH